MCPFDTRTTAAVDVGSKREERDAFSSLCKRTFAESVAPSSSQQPLPWTLRVDDGRAPAPLHTLPSRQSLQSGLVSPTRRVFATEALRDAAAANDGIAGGGGGGGAKDSSSARGKSDDAQSVAARVVYSWCVRWHW
jgi:hypothetical protein